MSNKYPRAHFYLIYSRNITYFRKETNLAPALYKLKSKNPIVTSMFRVPRKTHGPYTTEHPDIYSVKIFRVLYKNIKFYLKKYHKLKEEV